MNQKAQSPEMLLLVFIVCTALYKQFSYLILCRYITFINFWSLVADRSCCGILPEYFYNICHIRVNYVEIFIFISKLNVAKLPWSYYDVLYHLSLWICTQIYRWKWFLLNSTTSEHKTNYFHFLYSSKLQMMYLSELVLTQFH